MSKVILDPGLKAKLKDQRQSIELCEESGETIGFFVPRDQYLRLLYAEAKTQLTKEELEAAREDYRKNGGVTTADLLDHLRRLDERLRQVK